MGKLNHPGRTTGASISTPLDYRVAYLYHASTYLAGSKLSGRSDDQEDSLDPFRLYHKQQDPEGATESMDSLVEPAEKAAQDSPRSSSAPTEPSIRLMLSHLKGISRKARKGNTRIPAGMKRSICKRCDLLLIDGHNSSRRLENKSREGKKAWANVLVVACDSCGTAKRFPVGAKRQPRKKVRSNKSKEPTNVAPSPKFP